MDAFGESPGWRDGTVWGWSLVPRSSFHESGRAPDRHIGRPDLQVEGREVEPGLLTEVPGQSGEGRGSTGGEASASQERGPQGKGRNGIAAEVRGSGEVPASIFPPPPAGAAAETAGGGATAAEFANRRRARRGLRSCGSGGRSLDLVFRERGEQERERSGAEPSAVL